MSKLSTNSLFKHKQPIIIVSIALIAFFVINHTFQDSNTATNKAPTKSPQIDYYLNNFSSKIFENDGRLKYTLTGQRITHYQNNKTISIQQPILEYQNDSVWRLSGDEAIASENLQSRIEFTQNAKLVSDAQDNFSISADRFDFLPDQEIFKATGNEKPVTILWANGKISGKTMNANFANEQFTLKHVSAIYESK